MNLFSTCVRAVRRGAQKSRSRHRKRRASAKRQLFQSVEATTAAAGPAFSAAVGKNLPGLRVCD